jgi:hypothetical protein
MHRSITILLKDTQSKSLLLLDSGEREGAFQASSLFNMLRIAEIIIVFLGVSFAGNLPDTNLTPGSSYKFVTRQDLCGYRFSSSVPNLSLATKNKVFDRYGLSVPVRSLYTIDRLIPKSLGGNNSLQNLWPMRKDSICGPQAKAILGDTLNHWICCGLITISEAQQAITHDWIGIYQKYIQKHNPPHFR